MMPACDPERSVTKFGRKSATRPLAGMEICVDQRCGCLLLEADRVALAGGQGIHADGSARRYARADRASTNLPIIAIPEACQHDFCDTGGS